jgi:hypothetical protein
MTAAEIPATKKQTWALYCFTRQDWRNMNLTLEEASELIGLCFDLKMRRAGNAHSTPSRETTNARPFSTTYALPASDWQTVSLTSSRPAYSTPSLTSARQSGRPSHSHTITEGEGNAMTTREEIAAIRKALRALGFTGSVRNGRGTAYGWVDIRGTDTLGNFTESEKALLRSLGFTPGGNLCVIAPEERRYWVLKLTDPDNPLVIIEGHRAHQAWQSRMEA